MTIRPGVPIAMRKVFFLPMLAAGLLFFLFSCNSPTPASIEYEAIDTMQGPLQSPCNEEEVIRLETEEGKFTLKLVATYRVAAMVVGRKTYSSGWTGKIIPLDLALAWGDLGQQDSLEYVTFSQRDRWYFFEYKPESPFSASFVSEHSANTHIIPATQNILEALKAVENTQKVVLEGFLVNLNGTYKGQQVWWNSSLSRKDSGDNSCELLYVQKARVGEYVYE
jgi:hypothetical protein